MVGERVGRTYPGCLSSPLRSGEGGRSTTTRGTGRSQVKSATWAARGANCHESYFKTCLGITIINLGFPLFYPHHFHHFLSRPPQGDFGDYGGDDYGGGFDDGGGFDGGDFGGGDMDFGGDF